MLKNLITNQFVNGVIHVPDVEKNPHWNKLLHIYLPAKNSLNSSPDLEIITWNNLKSGVFETTCENHNVNCQVFGKKITQWSNYLKFQFNIEACLATSKKYIMGCDSHDAMLIGSPVKILEIFLNKKCKLLFNSEIKFYPDLQNPISQKWKQFQESIANSPMQYLNAGVWIGETNFVKYFFEECNKIRVHKLFDCSTHKCLCEDSIGCDQSSIHETFPSFWPDVQLNYDCDLFLNIANFTKEQLQHQFKIL